MEVEKSQPNGHNSFHVFRLFSKMHFICVQGIWSFQSPLLINIRKWSTHNRERDYCIKNKNRERDYNFSETIKKSSFEVIKSKKVMMTL